MLEQLRATDKVKTVIEGCNLGISQELSIVP